jgi:hypothetical protein
MSKNEEPKKAQPRSVSRWFVGIQRVHDYYLRLARSGRLNPLDWPMYWFTVIVREREGQVLKGLPEEREF